MNNANISLPLHRFIALSAMISIQNLSMHFTGNDLFSDISFLIRDKDRIGLVGKNGAGKTTLLKLICGLEQPSSGVVAIPRNTQIGYLPQEMNANSTKTVIDEAMTAFDEYHRLQHETERLQNELANRTDYESDDYQKLIEKLTHVNDRLDILGGNSAEGEAEKILVGLGFDHSDMTRQMNEFSNGWQMRVILAKILLQKPDLLLLDEPTNHLDIESIQWLETFLSSYYGAILMVSHDRTFLDNVTARTIEISGGKVYDYKASYSEYLALREERVAMQRSAYDNQQREIKEIEAFVERFRYKATKAKQVQSRVKMLEKMERVEIDDIDKTSIHFRFPPAPHSGEVSLELHGLSKAYGEKLILQNLDMLIPRGEKVAFVGRNGEGKSTLSKIICGKLDYQGEMKIGYGVKIGYYAQNQHDMLDLNKSVFETLDDVATGDMRVKVKGLLGAFLFRDDDLDKKVKVLSGGEKARLLLAKMLLSPVNLLVLDEPTNHLDMLSKDILKSALIQYDGTLIIVSHDRDFLQGLTSKVYEFRKPHIKEYIGDINDFLEQKNLSHLKELEIDKKTTPIERQITSSQNKINYEHKKQTDTKLRKIDKEIQRLEDAITKLESELAEQDKVMANTDQYPEIKVDNDWYWAYGKKKEELQRLMDEWGEKHIEREVVMEEYDS